MCKAIAGQISWASDISGMPTILLSKAWQGFRDTARRSLRREPPELEQETGSDGSPSGFSSREVAELYERYGYLLWKRSHAILRAEELADDALQDVFLKVMRHGASLRSADSKLAWLYTVTERCCLDIIKRRARGLGPIDAVEDPAAVSSSPAEGRDFLTRLLGGLAPVDRVLAILLFGEGCTQQEAAQRLGWSRQTINKKAKVIRARADELE